MKLEINVYDEKGKVTKTASAETVDLEFGAIRAIMELLKVDKIGDTAELLSTVYAAWEQITGILNRCFPDMEYNDWDHVKLKELIPVILSILKYSFAEILSIPKEKN